MARIRALMDNLAGQAGLIGEHGLSLLVEQGGKRILFDCGPGPNFLENSQKLGITLKDLDAVVLSHGHWDHAGGYPYLIRQGLGSRLLYTGPDFFDRKFTLREGKPDRNNRGFDSAFLQEQGICHREIRGLAPLFPGMWLLSGFPRQYAFEQIPSRFLRQRGQTLEPDDFREELCLVLAVEGGVALVTGCSHPGILNMVHRVRQTLGQPVRAVFGGTHLMEADEARIERTLTELEALGLEIFGLSHCSGEGAEAALRARPHLYACHLGSGDCIDI